MALHLPRMHRGLVCSVFKWRDAPEAVPPVDRDDPPPGVRSLGLNHGCVQVPRLRRPDPAPPPEHVCPAGSPKPCFLSCWARATTSLA
jgi:hypothetical protein